MTAPRSRTSVPVLFLLGSLLLSGGCDGGPLVPPDALPPDLRAPAVSTRGWTLVERPGFAFRVPPGFEKLDLQPIDSDAAIYENSEGSSLSYDFGIFGGSPSIPEGGEDVRRNVVTVIGGRRADLLAYRLGDEWFVGARWPDLGRALGSTVSLVITGRASDRDVRDRILASIHSVRFP